MKKTLAILGLSALIGFSSCSNFQEKSIKEGQTIINFDQKPDWPKMYYVNIFYPGNVKTEFEFYPQSLKKAYMTMYSNGRKVENSKEELEKGYEYLRIFLNQNLNQKIDDHIENIYVGEGRK